MFEPPEQPIQMQAIDLVRFGGPPWRVSREGYPDQEFDDWDEAYAYFHGDQHLLVARTIQGV